jgi:hypothetical protein
MAPARAGLACLLALSCLGAVSPTDVIITKVADPPGRPDERFVELFSKDGDIASSNFGAPAFNLWLTQSKTEESGNSNTRAVLFSSLNLRPNSSFILVCANEPAFAIAYTPYACDIEAEDFFQDFDGDVRVAIQDRYPVDAPLFDVLGPILDTYGGLPAGVPPRGYAAAAAAVTLSNEAKDLVEVAQSLVESQVQISTFVQVTGEATSGSDNSSTGLIETRSSLDTGSLGPEPVTGNQVQLALQETATLGSFIDGARHCGVGVGHRQSMDLSDSLQAGRASSTTLDSATLQTSSALRDDTTLEINELDKLVSTAAGVEFHASAGLLQADGSKMLFLQTDSSDPGPSNEEAGARDSEEDISDFARGSANISNSASSGEELAAACAHSVIANALFEGESSKASVSGKSQGSIDLDTSSIAAVDSIDLQATATADGAETGLDGAYFVNQSGLGSKSSFATRTTPKWSVRLSTPAKMAPPELAPSDPPKASSPTPPPTPGPRLVQLDP